YELVLERETFAQMDYGNYITLPHPNQIASEETFAYVAVLKEPVIWNKLPVQIVLLISIGRKEDRNRQIFYETTARFA
ncbi:PTS sugar transporter subunit IIA, partial [Clostridioides difficile]|nr:PTS sugar transporter subunit IIA [Clostridioides difficile]